MIALFNEVGISVSLQQVSAWLAADEDPGFNTMPDDMLGHFLNGLIVNKRGKKDGKLPPVDAEINHNVVLKKIQIAFSLTSDQVIELLASQEMTISASELSAFFRKPEHKNYRRCKSQVLRKLLMAIQVSNRGQTKGKGKGAGKNKSYRDDSSKPNKIPAEKIWYNNPKLQESPEKKSSGRGKLSLKK